MYCYKSNRFALLASFLVVASLLVLNVQACDVALVVKNATSLSQLHEQNVYDVLSGYMGLDVELIDSESYAGFNHSEYSLLVVAGRPTNVYSYEHLDSFVADLPVDLLPTVAIDSKYIDDWSWIDGGLSTKFSSAVQNIYIWNNTNEILQDYLQGDYVDVHIVEGKTILGIKDAQSKLQGIAYSDSFRNSAIISVMQEGTELYNGNVTQSRAVFFGVTNTQYWSTDARDLFISAINWVGGDTDGDGFIDAYDNCPLTPNPDQNDTDSDGLGDACDDDMDNDDVNNTGDNCPYAYNPQQTDMDNDDVGDLCDPEADGDGIDNINDNCPYIPNLGQEDEDLDGVGDLCDSCLGDPTNDADSDGICGLQDNCPGTANPGQEDADQDGIGDLCDTEDTRPDLQVLSIEFADNLLECDTVEVNVTIGNSGTLNATAYDLTLKIDGVTAVEQHVTSTITVGETSMVQLYPGDPQTCGSLSPMVRAEVSSVEPMGDTNESDNALEVQMNFLSIRRLDVDGDSVYERAVDSNSNDADGFEVYDDPNNSTAAESVDADQDGKADYLIDIGFGGMLDKIWDPDSGTLSDLLKVGDVYYVPFGNWSGVRKYENSSLWDASTLSQDIDSDGDNEIVIDVNSNSQVDAGDYILDSGFYSLPDLEVTGISYSPSNPVDGNSLTVTATVENLGGYGLANVTVEFIFDGSSRENKTLSLSGGGSAQVQFTLTVTEGNYDLSVKADPDNMITEDDEDNNQMDGSIEVDAQQSGQDTGGSGNLPSSGGGQSVDVSIALRDVPEEITLEVGEEYVEEIYLENTGDLGIANLEPHFLGAGSQMFSLQPDSIDIDEGDIESAQLIVNSDGALAGNYIITFEMRVDSTVYYSEEIALTIEEEQVSVVQVPEDPQGNGTGNGGEVGAPVTGALFDPTSLMYALYIIVIGAAGLLAYRFRSLFSGGGNKPPWQASIDKMRKKKLWR